jgi:hypothetical protein
MSQAARHRASLTFEAVLVTGLLALTGCSSMRAPTAQSIAGLSPSGTVILTEDFVTGLGGGNGSLNYQGQTFPFRLIGSVVGLGGGLSKINASGDVYKLGRIGDFPGRYTQSTGEAGLSTPGASDLWLRNGAGVIMHLQGTSSGAMLTLGRDEIFVRMSQ